MAKRVRKVKRKKIKIGRIFIALLILVGLGFGAIKVLDIATKKIINKEYYIASKTNKVTT